MDPYKQLVDEWLEESLYSVLQILEKLWKMGFEGGYNIVKAHVNSRKMDLNEKAAAQFETMPGKQGQRYGATRTYFGTLGAIRRR